MNYNEVNRCRWAKILAKTVPGKVKLDRYIQRSEFPTPAPSKNALSTWEQVFIGLGSNLGDRVAHLRFAVEALAGHPDLAVRACSPVFESPAHTRSPGEGQPPFLNAVLALSSRLPAQGLLAFCHRIEEKRGRLRGVEGQWAARQLDLDLLIFGSDARMEGELRVPHPRMSHRLFVLRPLADVAPDVLVPEPFGATVRQLLQRCTDASIPIRTSHRLTVPLRTDSG